MNDAILRTPAMAGRRSMAGMLSLAAVVLCAAVVPLLPPIEWKVRATILAAVVAGLAGVLYLSEGSLKRSPLDWPALGFIAVALAATAAAEEPLVSLYPSPLRGEGLLVTAAVLVVGLVAARLSSTHASFVLTAVLVNGSLVGAIAIAQYFSLDVLGRLGFTAVSFGGQMGGQSAALPFEPEPLLRRAYGTLGQPMFLGGFAGMVLPMSIALTMRAPGRRWWPYAAATVMIFGGLVASQTRAAWLAAAIGIMLVAWTLPHSQWRRSVILLAAAVALTVIMTAAVPEAAIGQRASTTFDAGDQSLLQRVYIWKHTVRLIAERPLLGWGFSSLVGNFPDYGSAEYLALFGRETVTLIDNPHNEILNVALSTGVLGLLMYLGVWATVMIGLVRRIRADRQEAFLSGALAASLISGFIWMQFAWSGLGVANLLWILLGLAPAHPIVTPDLKIVE